MSSKRAGLDSRNFAAPIHQILARAIAHAIKSTIECVFTQPGSKRAVPLTSSARQVYRSKRTRQPTVGAAEMGQEETSAYRIFLAGCLASSRQLLMKSCAVGLMVRFFKMTMPTGAWPSGCLMGRTFNSGRLAENL